MRNTEIATALGIHATNVSKMKKNEPLRFAAIKAALSHAKQRGILFQTEIGGVEVLARGDTKALSSLSVEIGEPLARDIDGEYIAVPAEKIDIAVQFAFVHPKKKGGI